MNETKIRNATSFKYVNTVGTNTACGIDMVIGGVKYAVPIDMQNKQYRIIKALADASTITIASAD
tara:strand:- start:1206 stop:1400 length:195 start_codon:yes stop_codon:yes gene_type:complete